MRKKPAKYRLRESFVAQVRERMAAIGMTQKELAERLGVSQPVVSRMLAGKHSPSLDLVERVSRELGCEPHLGLEPKT